MISNAKLDMNEKTVLKLRGLEDAGRVQKVIDSEVLRRIDPYTPKDTGELIATGVRFTKLGSGEVIQMTKYARRLYYNRSYNFQGAPKRGAFWFERMKADHKEKILAEAQRQADKV